MATITIQPTTLVYRASGNIFANYQNMWDGDMETCQIMTSTSAGYFRFSLAALPAGSVITKIRYRAALNRGGGQSAVPRASVGYGDASSRTDVTSYVSFPATSYHEKVEAYVDQTITESQSAQLLTNDPLVRLSMASSGTTECYEFWLDITYTPPSYAVTLAADPQDGGTVSGGGTYEHGTSVQVSATPATGYMFSQWSDANSQNPRTIVVTGPVSLTAYFTQSSNIYVGNNAARAVYVGNTQATVYIGNTKVL